MFFLLIQARAGLVQIKKNFESLILIGSPFEPNFPLSSQQHTVWLLQVPEDLCLLIF